MECDLNRRATCHVSRPRTTWAISPNAGSAGQIHPQPSRTCVCTSLNVRRFSQASPRHLHQLSIRGLRSARPQPTTAVTRTASAQMYTHTSPAAHAATAKTLDDQPQPPSPCNKPASSHITHRTAATAIWMPPPKTQRHFAVGGLQELSGCPCLGKE